LPTTVTGSRSRFDPGKYTLEKAMNNADYQLIGSQPSWYTAKVRAALQYKRLPYQELGTNFQLISEVVIPKTGTHHFPVVLCPDETVLKDSCDIVRELERRHPTRPLLPADPLHHLLAVLFETWADEFLIFSGIYYRWLPTQTRAWAHRMFAAHGGMGIRDQQLRASCEELAQGLSRDIDSRMDAIGFGDDEACREAERITIAISDALDRHLADNHCLLGDYPTLADCAMTGPYLAHLYRDPGPANDHIRRECIYLANWIDRMHGAAGEPDQGELRVCDSLRELLRTTGACFSEHALELLHRVNEKLPTTDPAQALPASFGKFDTRMGTARVPRPVSPYAAWKLHHLIDRYRALPPAERGAADELLDIAGFLDVCRFDPTERMAKRGFQLFRVTG